MSVYGQNYGMGYGGRQDRLAEAIEAQRVAQEPMPPQPGQEGTTQHGPPEPEVGGFKAIVNSLMQQLMQPQQVEVDEMRRESRGSELQRLTDELAGMDGGPQFWELDSGGK